MIFFHSFHSSSWPLCCSINSAGSITAFSAKSFLVPKPHTCICKTVLGAMFHKYADILQSDWAPVPHVCITGTKNLYSKVSYFSGDTRKQTHRPGSEFRECSEGHVKSIIYVFQSLFMGQKYGCFITCTNTACTQTYFNRSTEVFSTQSSDWSSCPLNGLLKTSDYPYNRWPCSCAFLRCSWLFW